MKSFSMNSELGRRRLTDGHEVLHRVEGIVPLLAEIDIPKIPGLVIVPLKADEIGPVVPPSPKVA